MARGTRLNALDNTQLTSLNALNALDNTQLASMHLKLTMHS